LVPEDWGLNYNSAGELFLNRFKLTDLADSYDTPLYVLDEKGLIERAVEFRKKAEKTYQGNTSVFYPFKCNSLTSVIQAVKQAGFSAEVMTDFELDQAVKCGYSPSEIIVNGPCKTEGFLNKCLKLQVKLIIIDSLSELHSLIKIIGPGAKRIKLLLRVNPGYIPSGLGKGSATGGPKSSFGFDSNEVMEALSVIKKTQQLEFEGIHFHIGTGIRNPKAYSKVITKLYPLFRKIEFAGFRIKILDAGGGFASMTTREMTSLEMLSSQIFDSYQVRFGSRKFYTLDDYFSEINKSVSIFFGEKTPKIIFEPGRCLTSANQLLLLKVHRIKERNGKKWLITDGGLGTITMPTYYEYHEIFLCNQFNRSEKEKVTITGPCCFASDIVYKNKLLPKVKEGEILALMDTGAYFNALESSFNFIKPAIVSVNGEKCRIARRRETYQDIAARDTYNFNLKGKGQSNEILSC